MKRILLLLLVAAGFAFPVKNGNAEEIVVSGFPLLGAEYIMGATRRVLPPEACDDGHILVLEHGFGSWFKVAYNFPSRFSWKPPEVAAVWINLDHLTFLEQVAEDCRLIRHPGSE